MIDPIILLCCIKPSQTNMHEIQYNFVENSYKPTICWNRICLTCYTHWYGSPNNLKKYTKKEWDNYINASFDTYNQERMFA